MPTRVFLEGAYSCDACDLLSPSKARVRKLFSQNVAYQFSD